MFGQKKVSHEKNSYDAAALELIDGLTGAYEEALSALALFYCYERVDTLIHTGDVHRAAAAIREQAKP